MRPSRILALAGLTALPLAAPATPALAAPPLIERVVIDEQFVDEEFSAICGFPVTGSARGHFSIRAYDREQGLIEGLTVSVTNTISGPGGEYTWHDTGTNTARVTPDGDVIVSIIGQVPFGFTGAMKLDPDTGDVILEPQHTTEHMLAEACDALAG